MKSLKLFSAVAFATTLFVQTLSANNVENAYNFGGTTLKIGATNENVIVNLGTVEKETVTIRIEDKDRNVVFSELVANVKDFTKKYNLKRLENGDYRLIVSKKTIRTVQPFSIERGVVVMNPQEQKEKFIPTVNFNKDKLDVNVLLGNYSNIIVKIYNEEGKEIFTDKHFVVLGLHKRYDFSQLPKGGYIAEVRAGDESFTYDIKK